MKYVSCPTGVVNAPVEIVWRLLMHPEGWGDFYNVTVLPCADPAGLAVVGQTVFAEKLAQSLSTKLQFRFTEIDALNYGASIRCMISIWRHCAGRHELYSRWDSNSVVCQLTTAGSAFQTGWRGAMLHFLCAAGLTAVRQTRWPGYSEGQSDFMRSLGVCCLLGGRSHHNANPVGRTQQSRILPLLSER